MVRESIYRKPHHRGMFERGFIALQDTFRRAVRRAIEDSAFASFFASDADVSARSPVTVTDRGRQRTI
jgi:hypothetical protein